MISFLARDEREIITLTEHLLQNGEGPRRDYVSLADITREAYRRHIPFEDHDVLGILEHLENIGYTRSNSPERWTLSASGVQVVYP